MLSTTGTKNGWMHPDFATATWDNDRNTATPEVAWPEVQRRYANSVRRIDDGVGDLLPLLKDLRLDGNTVVVFTSDNGPSAESYLKELCEPTFFAATGCLIASSGTRWRAGCACPRWCAGRAAYPQG